VLISFEYSIQTVYTLASATAVLFYDILLTYDREVSCIWKRKISAVTVLFICLRYVTLLSRVTTFASAVQPGILFPCQVIGYLSFVSSDIARAASAIFGSLRIWAIWGRHWLLLALVLPISLFPVAVDLYQFSIFYISALALPIPLGGCFEAVTVSSDTLMRLGIAARACAITSDGIILIATWTKTWSIRQGLKTNLDLDLGRSRVSVAALLIRDGTMYFAALCCLNIAALVLDTTPQVDFNPTSSFIDSFTAILLCRLILNLRSYDIVDKSSFAPNVKQMTSVRFANTILDNIGASISILATDEDADFESLNVNENKVDATLDDIVNNPLVIGLEAEIWGTDHQPSNTVDVMQVF